MAEYGVRQMPPETFMSLTIPTVFTLPRGQMLATIRGTATASCLVIHQLTHAVKRTELICLSLKVTACPHPGRTPCRPAFLGKKKNKARTLALRPSPLSIRLDLHVSCPPAIADCIQPGLTMSSRLLTTCSLPAGSTLIMRPPVWDQVLTELCDASSVFQAGAVQSHI